MSPLPEQRLVYLDWLRSLAIIGVVFIHTFDPFVTQPWGQVVSAWQIALAGLARFAVPLYVMISGALLLGKREPISAFYTKRVNRVVIPLLIWSGIFLLWYSWSDPAFNWYEALFRLFVFGQPFYLLFVLVGLYAITPFVRTYIHAASSSELLCATALCLGLSSSVSLLQEWLIAPRNILPLFSLNYFVFFIGYYLAGYVLHHEKVKSAQAWAWLVGGYAATVLGSLWFSQKFGVTPKGLVWWGYLTPNVIAMSLGVFVVIKNLASRIVPTNRIRACVFLLAGSSLGIYFIHQLLLDVSVRYQLITEWSPVVSISVFMLALLVSLLLVQLLKRSRKLAHVLGV